MGPRLIFVRFFPNRDNTHQLYARLEVEVSYYETNTPDLNGNCEQSRGIGTAADLHLNGGTNCLKSLAASNSGPFDRH